MGAPLPAPKAKRVSQAGCEVLNGMKVSVITVCFNSANTIGDTLRSVAQQTYPNVEHVIIDGGSRDDTVDLAKSLVRSGGIVHSEADKGIYDAMNKGLRLATGDIIGFLNADDVYADNDLLRRIVEMMQRMSLDALFGDVEFFKSEVPEKVLRRYRSNRFRPDRIGWGWMPAHPTLFLRRRVFDEFGYFRENYRIAGDFELIARIFKSNTLIYHYVPEAMVRMRSACRQTLPRPCTSGPLAWRLQSDQCHGSGVGCRGCDSQPFVGPFLVRTLSDLQEHPKVGQAQAHQLWAGVDHGAQHGLFRQTSHESWQLHHIAGRQVKELTQVKGVRGLHCRWCG